MRMSNPSGVDDDSGYLSFILVAWVFFASCNVALVLDLCLSLSGMVMAWIFRMYVARVCVVRGRDCASAKGGVDRLS